MQRIQIDYQQIPDNVGLLNDVMLNELNEAIVAFRHGGGI